MTKLEMIAHVDLREMLRTSGYLSEIIVAFMGKGDDGKDADTFWLDTKRGKVMVKNRELLCRFMSLYPDKQEAVLAAFHQIFDENKIEKMRVCIDWSNNSRKYVAVHRIVGGTLVLSM